MKKEKAMRILLVDDHNLFGKSLSSILSNYEDISEFKHIANPAYTESMITAFNPSVILMDIQMGKYDGLELGAELLKKYSLKIIFLSGFNLQAYRDRAETLGAYGFLDKHIEISTLIEAIRKVHYQDEKVFPEILTASSLERPLTQREKDILLLISKGIKQVAIANELDISERTLQNQLGSVNKKLGTTSAITAVIKAIELGLIPIIF